MLIEDDRNTKGNNRMTELKPCPFCKGEACADKLFTTKQPSSYFIYCKSCAVESAAFPTLKEAIDFWNTQQPQGINWQPITQLSARQGMYAIFTSINRAFAINSYKLVATEWEAQYLANHYTHFIEIVPPEE